MHHIWHITFQGFRLFLILHNDESFQNDEYTFTFTALIWVFFAGYTQEKPLAFLLTLHSYKATSFTFTFPRWPHSRSCLDEAMHRHSYIGISCVSSLQIHISHCLLSTSPRTGPSAAQNKTDYLCFSPPLPSLPLKNKNNVHSQFSPFWSMALAPWQHSDLPGYLSQTSGKHPALLLRAFTQSINFQILILGYRLLREILG